LARSLLLACVYWSAASGASPARTDASAPRASFREDLDSLLDAVQENYAYFDLGQADWTRVRRHYSAQVASVATKDEFIGLLEAVLDELHDDHSHLNVNRPHSFRLVPSGADVWAEWVEKRAMVVQVRPDSNAERAGMRPGMEIVSINGVPIADATAVRLGLAFSEATGSRARDWALRSVLAGRHDEPRRLRVVAPDGAAEELAVDDRVETGSAKDEPLLESRRIGRLGYVRINNSLGHNELIKAFDDALERLRETQGLVLDLRDTPSGGNTTVARSILSRFTSVDRPYQRHEDPSEERAYAVKRRWVEWVSPRGPFVYSKPVVVLVDHWTGSVGEAIAIGFDAMGRATVVGTRMAGLLGATSETVLPRSGIGVHFATERLSHINGTPRESYIPPVLVDPLSSQSRDASDPILAAGMTILSP